MIHQHGDILLVEVPEDSVEKVGNAFQFYFAKMSNELVSFLKEVYYQKIDILGLAKDLTEEQWKEFCPTISNWPAVLYYDHKKPQRDFRDIVEAAHDTATESGLSLIASYGMKKENCLILKKMI